MMTSEAYQMASAFDSGGNTSKDPENLYLWHFRPQRLEAEIIRDNMLSVSGGMDLQMGGQPPCAAIAARQFRHRRIKLPLARGDR